MSHEVRQKLDIEGAEHTLRALELVEPDLKKRLRTGLSDIGKQVASRAGARVQSRSGDMRAGYNVRTRWAQTGVSVTVRNQTPQGQILEFAGSTTSGRTRQGRSLIATLTRRYGKTGRFMWAAYDSIQPEQQVIALVRGVESDLENRLRRGA